jgi:hypothetical protein
MKIPDAGLRRRLALLPAAAIAALVSALQPATAAEMTLAYSWKGIPGCHGVGVSPAFQVRNAPPGTHLLLFTLDNMDKAWEHGGSTVVYALGGDVPRGAVSTTGPCQEAKYQWTAQAQDAIGRVLGTARLTRPFPDR